MPSGTIAITGGTGFIGRALLPRLASRELRVLARSHSALPGDVRPVLGDLENDSSLDQLLAGAAVLIHLAGIAHAQLRTKQERDRAWHVNVESSKRLFDKAVQHGVRRVIVASSAHVYGESGVALKEDAPRNGNHFYALSKVALEDAARSVATEVEVIIVRPCLTYGPGAKFNLCRLMQGIRSGYYFNLAGYDPLRSFLGIGNAAAAIVHLMEHGQPGESYNLADRTPVRLSAFTGALAQAMDLPIPRHLPLPISRSLTLTLNALGGIGMGTARNVARRLTESFTLSVDKLAATGFEWRSDSTQDLRAMARHFLNGSAKGAAVQSCR